MARYFLRRVLISIPTLLFISFIIFAILALAPGDPLSQFAANPAVPPAVREQIRHSLGLDQPWPIRYVHWLWALLHGDLGYSFASRIPVTILLQQRLPNTLAVLGVSYVVSVLIALPVGVFSATKRNTIFDYIATGLTFVGFSTPTFFTGILLILLFSVQLRWFPFIYDSTIQVHDLPTLWAQFKQSVMPITVLALFQTASLARFVRAEMIENLPLDYVRTARAKGLRNQIVILRHVVRNSLIPVITLVALGIPSVFAGAVITEQIFRVPGIGDLLIHSIENSDTPVVMAVTFMYAVLVVIFNLIADLVYGLADPRIRYS